MSYADKVFIDMCKDIIENGRTAHLLIRLKSLG